MTTAEVRPGVRVKCDPEDVERIERYVWSVRKKDRRVYRKKRGGGTWYLAWEIAGEPAPGMNIDHINGDQFDNRKSNLRLATPSQNMANRKRQQPRKSGTGKSRFKGVTYHGSWVRNLKKPWRADVQKAGEKRYAYFATEEEAAMWYDAKAVELHGKFAKTNEDLGLYEEC